MTLANRLFLFLAFGSHMLSAAVGCDLNDPDRDVRRLFPNSTAYKTQYVSIARSGGMPLQRQIEARLGDVFHGLFETMDVPYTVYSIYQDKKLIGYIHGVNQKGQYGGIQVFLALDPQGVIQAFYFQKMTNRQARELRDPAFGRQFIGLALHDFAAYDVISQTAKPDSRVARIINPAPEAVVDFRAALRATKKNLILCQVFLFGGLDNER